jgi:hypothetical protein
VPISFPQIKGVHEVSCVPVCHCWFSYQSDSFRMKQVHHDECILKGLCSEMSHGCFIFLYTACELTSFFNVFCCTEVYVLSTLKNA